MMEEFYISKQKDGNGNVRFQLRGINNSRRNNELEVDEYHYSNLIQEASSIEQIALYAVLLGITMDKVELDYQLTFDELLQLQRTTT